MHHSRWLLERTFHNFWRKMVSYVWFDFTVIQHFFSLVETLIFVWFDSLRSINNLSAIKGRVLLGWTSTKPGLMFLLKDTTQWRRWGSNPRPLGLESSIQPLSRCAPYRGIDIFLGGYLCSIWMGLHFMISVICVSPIFLLPNMYKGAQWLSGRVLDSRPRGRGFEPHRRHCVVVLEQDTFILA